MKNILKFGVIALTAATMLTACDWTDPEPVDLRYDTIKEAAPDAYQTYLTNLRQWRGNGHKKVYAWFSNKTSFASQADHVATVPDSIDVLVLSHPEALSQETLDEIDTKRSETGMQTAYVISYADIRKAWELKKELETANNPVPAWDVFMADSLKTALSYFDGGGYDRLMCAYDGRDMKAFGTADRAAYAAEQKAFIDPFAAWCAAHVDAGFDFIGIPANLTDQSLLANAGNVFLSESAQATNVYEYSTIIARNSVEGAPTAKFAVLAYVPVLDPTKTDLGYWNGEYSSWLAARWARNGAVCALGLLDISDDYYNPSFIYPVTRGAIQILNPSATATNPVTVGKVD